MHTSRMNPVLPFIVLLTSQLQPTLVSPETEQQKAISLYPELGKAGSPLNSAFVHEVEIRKATNPNFFRRQNWPTLLAKELSEIKANALLTKERAERMGAEAEKNALLEKQREAERTKAMLKTIREVESDQRAFIGKQFMLTGSFDISSFYHSGYSEAQNTHFAFELRQPGKSALLYMPRASGEKVREKLVKHDGPFRATCVVTILANRLQENSGLHAELIEVRAPIEK